VPRRLRAGIRRLHRARAVACRYALANKHGTIVVQAKLAFSQ
jgi:hypothetical protein